MIIKTEGVYGLTVRFGLINDECTYNDGLNTNQVHSHQKLPQSKTMWESARTTNIKFIFLLSIDHWIR